MQIEPLGGPGFETPSAYTPTTRQTQFLTWMTDVLIYVVVINLFVEYAPNVIIESFTISILTAVLLKLLLDAMMGLEHRVNAWFAAREGTAWRVAGVLTFLLILFGSKFVILWITDVVFRGQVELGGFVEIIVLVVSMIAARAVVTLVYFRVLGPKEV